MASPFDAYLTGTANPQFAPGLADPLQRFLADAPGQGVSIYSGYRSPEKQAMLYQRAIDKYGSPEAARKWVAPPGRSNHNRGFAADLRFASPDVQKWAHENAAKYGLTFRMSHEPWHIEPLNKSAAPTMGSINPSPKPAAPSYPYAAVPSPVLAAKPNLLDSIKAKLPTGIAGNSKLSDAFGLLAAMSAPEPMQLTPMQAIQNQSGLADFMKTYVG